MMGMSRARKVAASGSLVATAAGLGALAVDRFSVEWPLVAFAGLVALAGFGLSMKSLVVQVLSRATAWILLAPSLAITAVMLLRGTWPDPTGAGLLLGSGAALLLARPMLHTDEAKAAFAPKVFRRTLLAASTASAMTGIVTGIAAVEQLGRHTFVGVGLGTLALLLLASAIGVVRMRAWGILLGGATSLLTLLSALVLHDGAGFALAIASLPGILLTLIVVLARLRPVDATTALPTRVAVDEPVRIRIAEDELLEDEIELRVSSDGRAETAARLSA